MAWLNDVYVFVKDENLTHDVETTSHPVENGVDITDHIRRLPVEINISGAIVYHDGINASDTLERLKQMQYAGTIINFAGRNAVSGLVIESFSTSHPNTVAGGAEFTMTLKQIRIAQPAYMGNSVAAENYEAVESGGGEVAEAEEVMENGGNIVIAENENPEPVNAGTQQVKLGDGKKIYHTVRSGETLYTIAKSYQELSPRFENDIDKMNWIMEQNPYSFWERGNADTLVEGTDILVGIRDNINDVYSHSSVVHNSNKLLFMKAGE